MRYNSEPFKGYRIVFDPVAETASRQNNILSGQNIIVTEGLPRWPSHPMNHN